MLPPLIRQRIELKTKPPGLPAVHRGRRNNPDETSAPARSLLRNRKLHSIPRQTGTDHPVPCGGNHHTAAGIKRRPRPPAKNGNGPDRHPLRRCKTEFPKRGPRIVQQPFQRKRNPDPPVLCPVNGRIHRHRFVTCNVEFLFRFHFQQQCPGFKTGRQKERFGQLNRSAVPFPGKRTRFRVFPGRQFGGDGNDDRDRIPVL